MPRLPPADPAADPELAEVLARVSSTRGVVSNVIRSLAHAPRGLRAFSELGEYGRYGTALTDLQREIVILTVGRDIAYAWAHHAPLGLQAGLTDEQLAAIRGGRTPAGLPPAEAALADYAREFAAMKGVADSVFARMQAHYTPRQITDVSLLCGYYMALGAVIIAFEVPPDAAELIARGAVAARTRAER
jgi:4-carboxymuconolactone decarboxylase